MKKVGIVTAYDTLNYGNRLQNFAVQLILQKRGFTVETLAFQEGSELRKWYIHRIVNFFRRVINKDKKAIRRSAFYRFNRKYIRIRRIYIKNDMISSKIKDKYIYFIAGSDQIWNYTYQSNSILKAHLLTFADDKQKICISPSMGVPIVDRNHEKLFIEGLKGFKYLSCREKQGAIELTRVTGKKCEWLIDPTLYVTREEWVNFFSGIHQQRRPYIFVFFLAGIKSELGKFIQDFAKDRYEIINPSDHQSKYFGVDPACFISLLSNARMVFTDSFHVTAFAINFHIPFYVFNRIKSTLMTSRIESICELFQLKDRYILQQAPFPINEECQFDNADKQLQKERKKFSLYLDQCFEK